MGLSCDINSTKRHKILRQALKNLRTHRQYVEASGPIAPAGVWIEIYRPGGRDIDYARLESGKGDVGQVVQSGVEKGGVG